MKVETELTTNSVESCHLKKVQWQRPLIILLILANMKVL